MIKNTCATPTVWRRALAIGLSSFILSMTMVGSSYAYTVDDLREFTGTGLLSTASKKAELSTKIYNYEQQQNNNSILENINSSTINEDIKQNYDIAVAELESINSDIDSALNTENALDVLELYRKADTVSRKIDKYNLEGLSEFSMGNSITEEDYNTAKLNLGRADEGFELGDIGNSLHKVVGPEEMKMYLPYGDYYNDSLERERMHSNGIWLYVNDSKNEVKNVWNGTVEKVVDSADWGKYIVVRHGGNLTSSISFLSDVYVNEGQKINQFDTIGKSEGGIVYIEIILDGKYIDPVYAFGSNGARAYNMWAASNSDLVTDYIDYSTVKDKVEFPDERVPESGSSSDGTVIETTLLD